MNCSGQGSSPPFGCERGAVRNPLPAHGSPSRQRILRVSMDVHNNKDMGP
jgi:hypothetical protein